MVSDRQVRKLSKKLAEGKTVLAAADAAGMSEKSAHAWKQGPLPSEVRSNRERKWRTREDPFAGAWESELLPLLVADKEGVLEATTLLKALEEKKRSQIGSTQRSCGLCSGASARGALCTDRSAKCLSSRYTSQGVKARPTSPTATSCA